MKEIVLNCGRIAVVSDEDYERLSKYTWYYHHKGYAQRNTTKEEREKGLPRVVLMHREVLGFPNSWIDFKNGNGLDCRRENLRLATPRENARNRKKVNKATSSRYKGVTRLKNGRYMARVQWQEGDSAKYKYLGVYKTEEEAAKAYDEAAIEIFGEFALPNFPKGAIFKVFDFAKRKKDEAYILQGV